VPRRLAAPLVFATASALSIVRGVIGYGNPQYWDPVTRLDWASVVTYSLADVACAAALLLVARELRGAPQWLVGKAAFGALLTAVGNAVEDGLGVHSFDIAFLAGVLLMTAGMLLGGIALLVGRSAARPIGIVLVVDVAALALAFDDMGLIVLGVSWLVVAALLSLGRRQAAPAAA
jgi:hypothetical protein